MEGVMSKSSLRCVKRGGHGEVSTMSPWQMPAEKAKAFHLVWR